MALNEIVAIVHHIGANEILMRTDCTAIDGSRNLVLATMVKPMVLEVIVEMLLAAVSYIAIRSAFRAYDNSVIPANSHLAT
jgi:hypothetical protein